MTIISVIISPRGPLWRLRLWWMAPHRRHAMLRGGRCG